MESGNSMGKNVRLANIYIKIHNKKPLTMDDLVFLAKYDRECFEKTCRNVLYKLPESKPFIQEPSKKEVTDTADKAVIAGPPALLPVQEREYKSKDQVEAILARLHKMEAQELMVQDVSAEQVKNLIGNLFMEKLFPHNDKEQYFDMQEGETSFFNKKA